MVLFLEIKMSLKATSNLTGYLENNLFFSINLACSNF
jgi:hypothetical protein